MGWTPSHGAPARTHLGCLVLLLAVFFLLSLLFGFPSCCSPGHGVDTTISDVFSYRWWEAVGEFGVGQPGEPTPAQGRQELGLSRERWGQGWQQGAVTGTRDCPLLRRIPGKMWLLPQELCSQSSASHLSSVLSREPEPVSTQSTPRAQELPRDFLPLTGSSQAPL